MPLLPCVFYVSGQSVELLGQRLFIMIKVDDASDHGCAAVV